MTPNGAQWCQNVVNSMAKVTPKASKSDLDLMDGVFPDNCFTIAWETAKLSEFQVLSCVPSEFPGPCRHGGGYGACALDILELSELISILGFLPA